VLRPAAARGGHAAAVRSRPAQPARRRDPRLARHRQQRDGYPPPAGPAAHVCRLPRLAPQSARYTGHRRGLTAQQETRTMKILGIDIGATDISGAPVDTDDGALLAEPVDIDTPDPATPDAIAGVVAEITRRFDWHGPIGVAFPAVIKDCVVQTAVNVDESWVGIDAAALFEGATGQPVAVLNDADAAGLAEVVFGAGRGRDGKVIVVTIGTGLGVAVFE